MMKQMLRLKELRFACIVRLEMVILILTILHYPCITKKQACCAGCRAKPSQCNFTSRLIHPFSKITVTFDLIQPLRCPSGIRIYGKMSI